MPTLTDELEPCAPAHLTRTAGEFLGRRPLPRVLATRMVVFLAGPQGSGKSLVAAKLAGPDAMVLDNRAVQQQLVSRARYNRFAPAVVGAPRLILDGVDFLYGREGATRLLGGLLAERAAAGRLTVVVGGNADDSMQLLYPSVAPHQRASVLLRFPVGRGRRRFVQQECVRLSLPFVAAKAFVTMEPWSYAEVRSAVEDLVAK